MAILPPTQNPVRLTLLGLFSVATSLVMTPVITVPAATGSVVVLLFAVVLTDLLHEYSSDTSDPVNEPQPPDSPEPDLDTGSLLINAWRDDW